MWYVVVGNVVGADVKERTVVAFLGKVLGELVEDEKAFPLLPWRCGTVVVGGEMGNGM